MAKNMPRTFTFYVPGKAVGKARPRFTRSGRAYTPAKSREYEEHIREAFLAAGGSSFGGAPLAVTILIEAELPKSRPARVTVEPWTTKPDADNVVKSVLDALNGMAWRDDAQITSITAVKRDRTRKSADGVTVTIQEATRWGGI